MADWVEQALAWAQRISNGESWEAVCNDADTANWCRLVVWKNGKARHVGGAHKDGNRNPASLVGTSCFGPEYKLLNAVPLVVRYKSDKE